MTLKLQEMQQILGIAMKENQQNIIGKVQINYQDTWMDLQDVKLE